MNININKIISAASAIAVVLAFGLSYKIFCLALHSEFETEPFIRGDISGNGKLDIYDAIEINKSLIGARVFTGREISAADYNSDGGVDLYDAVGIAEYLADTS